MKKSIRLFSLLDEENCCWLLQHAHVVCFSADSTVLERKDAARNIYIVAGGLLYADIEGHKLAQKTLVRRENFLPLSVGDVFGISSFLDNSEAKMTIKCAECATIFMIKGEDLYQYINENPCFGMQFYRALAILLSDRFKSVNYGYVNFIFRNQYQVEQQDEILFVEFNQFLNELQNAALKLRDKQQVKDALCAKDLEDFESIFSGIVQFSDECCDEAGHPHLYEYMRRELSPYLLMSNCIAYCINKPSGYDGDYSLLKKIYENKPKGSNLIGESIDHYFLSSDFCEAVRKRAQLIRQYFHDIIFSANNNRVEISGFAPGPAEEVMQAMPSLHDFSNWKINLHYFDRQSADWQKQLVRDHNMNGSVKVHCHEMLSFLYSDNGDACLKQDYVYILGLINCLDNKAAVSLLDKVYEMLSDQGLLTIGVMLRDHQSGFFMKELVNWTIYYRDQESVKQLLKKSKFKSSFSKVWEASSSYLFFDVVR